MCVCPLTVCIYHPRDVDDIHDMMDDITEQNEISEEITNVLSQPVGFGTDVDDVSVCVFSAAVTTLMHEGSAGFINQTLHTVRMICWLSWRRWNRKSWRVVC